MATAAIPVQLPALRQFDPKGEPSTLAQRWEKWRKSFSYFIEASGIVNDGQKRATLLHMAGEEVQQIFDTLPNSDEATTFQQALTKLNDQFNVKKNVPYERIIFHEAKQESGESVDAFVTRLRKLAQYCEYTNLDDEIRDQVIAKCRSSKFRKRLLQETDLNLEKLLRIGRALEQSASQTKKIEENASSVGEVNTMMKRNHFGNKRNYNKNNGKKVYNKSDDSRDSKKFYNDNPCGRCGMTSHSSKDCRITKGKTCKKCSLIGHFAKCCKTKLDRQKHKVRTTEDNASEEESNSSDEDDCYVFCIKSKDKPLFEIEVQESPITILVDSGSTLNILDSKTFKKIVPAPKLEKCSTKIYPYQGKTSLKVRGTFKANTRTSYGKIAKLKYYVVEGDGGALLGLKSAKILDLIRIGPPNVESINNMDTTPVQMLLSNAEKIITDKTSNSEVLHPKIQEVLDRHNKVFSGMGKLKNFQLKLHIDESITPVQQPVRRLPYHTRQTVSDEIDRLVKNDCIEKVNGPTSWINPIVVVPKANGKIRLCIDMRRANEAIIRERHQIPKLDEILPELNDAKYFCKLDLREGYHQIELDESSRHITSFITHKGCYQSKRLIYGANSAFEQFQKTIEQCIAGCDGTKSISDDILLWGKSIDETATRLDKLLKTLYDNGLRVNSSKCVFAVNELTFSGYRLTDKGIFPDKSKVDAVNQTKRPTNATEVRSFLGLVNYCSQFIHHYADLTEPLRKLTKKNVEFQWNEAQENSFVKLKEELTNSRVMAYYQPYADTKIIVDASPIGLGAILTQKQRNNTFKPIAYASKALNETEQRYSQTERESLAVLWGIQKFHYHLYDRDFTVITDHKPLEKILSSRGNPTPRIQRWVLKLQPYKFKVVYEPGATNASDVLSRSPLEAPGTSDYFTNEAEHYVNTIINDATPIAVTIKEIADDSATDEELAKLRVNIKLKKWNKYPEMKQYYLCRNELVVKDNLVLKGNRLVIPKTLRKRILDSAHEHHLGIVKTKGLIRGKVWWPGIDKEIEEMIRTCMSCQATSSAVVRPTHTQSTEIPPTSWHTLALDIQGPYPTMDYLIVLIDYRSRYPVVIQTKKIDTDHVIKGLDKTFKLFGYPMKLIADNGKQMISQEFKSYLKENGIELHSTTPYSPWANGEVERFNRSLKKANQCAHAAGKDWRKELDKFLLLYRTTPHATTNTPPATVMFGRNIRNKIPVYSKFLSENLKLDETDRRNKRKTKEYADTNRKTVQEHHINVRDSVLARNMMRKDKLSTNWIPKPFTVIKSYEKSALIEDAQGRRYMRKKIHEEQGTFKKIFTKEGGSREESKRRHTQRET